MDINTFHISYFILVRDFNKLLEYIHPTDINLKTYSHRVYEIFFRVCTEFENVSKEKLIEDRYQKEPSKFNIYDYALLGEKLKLTNCDAGVRFWESEKYVQPFADWKSGKTLGWYSSYNKVKHNRTSEFKEANFSNLTEALAATTILLHKIFYNRIFIQNDSPQYAAVEKVENEKKLTEFKLTNIPFTIREISV